MLDLRTDIGKNTLATRFHIDAHLIHRLVKGALEVKNKYPDAVMIFISPAKRETIEERLRGRSTESEEQLKIRTKSAIEEIKQAVFYDYIVVNEDALKGAQDIIAIIEAEKCKVKNNKKFIDNLIYGGNEL